MSEIGKIKDFVLSAESKALATYGSEGLNVVPVSVIKIIDENIILLDFFMGKTVKNIKENPNVSLTVWKGLEGYQFKCEVEYITEGDLFDSENAWSTQEFPERTLKGVLILKLKEIYSVSAGIRAGEKVL